MKQRESFSSRLGFLLISAGCAIGLGNVWRFPYITGQYGGAAFVVVYLLFLVIMGLPVMVMEFSVGRGSQKSMAGSFQALEPKGTRWHWYSWFGLAGNYLLMMFYTSVSGWLILYCIKMAKGDFHGLDTAGVSQEFGNMLSQPGLMTVFMVLVVVGSMLVVSRGLQNGVEKINKAMMLCLLAVMVLLAVRSLTLEGGMEGLAFYLMPNFHNLMYDAQGNFILWEAIYAAMGQAFFTLSLGIGALAIFGRYIGKEHTLPGEALRAGLQPVERLPASGGWHFHHGFGGLPGQRQHSASGLSGVSAVLRHSQGLGLGQLPGRGQHRFGPALPPQCAFLCDIPAAHYHVHHLCHGLLEPLLCLTKRAGTSRPFFCAKMMAR